MYFRIVGCIYVTWSFWLPVPEEYLLPFSREIVLHQGTRLFPFVFGFQEETISAGCFLFWTSSVKDGFGKYCVLCITLVNFVCSVP